MFETIKNTLKNTVKKVAKPIMQATKHGAIGGTIVTATAAVAQAGGILESVSMGAIIAASTPYLPIAAISFTTIAFGSLGYQAWKRYQTRNGTNETEDKKNNQKININNAFNPKSCNKINELTLENLDDELIKLANESLKKHGKKPSNRTPRIDKIIIKDESISLAQLKSLLKNGLGHYATEHLEICNTKLGNTLVANLYTYIKEGAFSQLKTLVLRNNQLDVNALRYCGKIGKRLDLTHLDLSNNEINSEDYAMLKSERSQFKQFFDEFYQKFPLLTHLKLNDTKLDSSALHYLVPLFEQPSLLKTLDIKKNPIKNSLIKLLKSTKVKKSLNIQVINHGFENDVALSKLTSERAAKISKIAEDLYVNLNESHLTIEILHKLKNQGFNALPASVKAHLRFNAHNQKLDGHWSMLSNKMNKLIQSNQAFTSQHFKEALLDKCSEQSLYIEELMNKILTSRGQVALNANSPDNSFLVQAGDFTDRLHETLDKLTEVAHPPKLQHINLSNTQLSSDDFINLLVRGIGDYKTQFLDLSNNQLDDESLVELAETQLSFNEVKHLNLSNNKMTAKSLAHIAKFGQRVGLESLDISEQNFNLHTAESQTLLTIFLQNLHQTIPTLKKLNISHIGLGSRNIELLSPIMSHFSLLEEINIHQKTCTRYTDYQKLLKKEGFKQNLGLNHIETGKNSAKHIKLLLNDKNSHIKQYKQSTGHQDKPAYLSLLQQVMGLNKTPIQEALDEKLKSTAAGADKYFCISLYEKLELEARRLQFHRDVASLNDKQIKIPKTLDQDEFIAFKQGELKQYWAKATKQRSQTKQQQIETTPVNYDIELQPSRPLKVHPVLDYKIGNSHIVVYYAQDDSIRVVNLTQKQQFGFSRYQLALELKNDAVKNFQLPGCQDQLVLNGQAHIYSNVSKKILVADTDVIANKYKTLLVDFSRYIPKESLEEIYQVPTRGSASPIPQVVTPQFQAHREQNSSATQSQTQPSIQLNRLSA